MSGEIQNKINQLLKLKEDKKKQKKIISSNNDYKKLVDINKNIKLLMNDIFNDKKKEEKKNKIK